MRPMARMRMVLALIALLVVTTPSLHADWSPELAARYLDGRQKDWFVWKPAMSADGPCVSCHTGMTYLLARPALRTALKENEPTIYEKGLLDRLRANVGAKPAGALQGVETVFSAMFLSREDAKNTMSAHTRKAFDQLWTLQNAEGPATGAWRWYAANLDPWENAESGYYGASLAALAIGQTPSSYRDEANVRDHIASITTYLANPPAAPRLHDRLALLWASSTLPTTAMPEAARKALTAEVFEKQGADGGWTLESLGPWMAHADAPPSSGSNSYATAFTAFVLHRAGVAASHPGLARALAWLRSHQDPKTGAWPAVSMNKRYPADSMESLFMQDAATAFASLSLIESAR
jgi:squalene-hopene/tetraprenyl-beta-curcumene cyclase